MSRCEIISNKHLCSVNNNNNDIVNYYITLYENQVFLTGVNITFSK